MAPASTYLLPESDRALSEDVRNLLRVHPLSYQIERVRFARCPTCEQWTRPGGCDVRKAAEAGHVEYARELHDDREWPAGTGKATTEFRGMKVDYRRVSFEYTDAR